MDSENQNQNLEELSVAIKRLIEEMKNKSTSADDQLLLSQLLAQLESVKEQQQADTQSETRSSKRETACTDENVDNTEKEEIVKEIKEVKRQNAVTHWLLSIMIVLTLGWQISEVSLLLKVREGLSNPFKSLGGMLTSMLKRRRPSQEDDGDSLAQPPPPPLKIPELPRVGLPDLSPNGQRH